MPTDVINAPAPRLFTAAGVLCVGLSLLTSCTRREGGAPAEPPPANRLHLPAPVPPAQVAAPAPPSNLYDGLTLDQWRDRIQQLDFKSPERAAAVPGLREIIRDSDAPWFTRRQAALTLGRIAEPATAAIADLMRLLDEPVEPVETTPPLWSLKSLALFGPLAVQAAPKTTVILNDNSIPLILRLTATETLARIGASSASGIQALIDGSAGTLTTSSESDHLELRVACIEALQLPAPASAVPVLMTACEDPAERIRHAAAATLGFLGTRAEPTAELLGSLTVFDDSPVVRETAARALAKIGDRAAEVLQRLLAHDDAAVQLLAIDAISRTTIDRRGIAYALKPLLDSPEPFVAARALDAWWTLTRDPDPILDKLITFVESDDRRVRKSASDTLLRMGPAASPMQMELKRIVREGSPSSKTAAERILRSISPPVRQGD